MRYVALLTLFVILAAPTAALAYDTSLPSQKSGLEDVYTLMSTVNLSDEYQEITPEFTHFLQQKQSSDPVVKPDANAPEFEQPELNQ